MGSSMAPSHVSLIDTEQLKSRSLRFQRLPFRNSTELGYMLLLKINRKLTMGSPMVYVTFDLERSRSRSLRLYQDFEVIYLVTELI